MTGSLKAPYAFLSIVDTISSIRSRIVCLGLAAARTRDGGVIFNRHVLVANLSTFLQGWWGGGATRPLGMCVLV